MQGSTPFHLLQLTELTALAPQVTDTALPFTPVPIYFIHSLERPFYKNSRCKCHWQQRQIQRLLGHILEGDMTLKEAMHFMEEVNGEGK